MYPDINLLIIILLIILALLCSINFIKKYENINYIKFIKNNNIEKYENINYIKNNNIENINNNIENINNNIEKYENINNKKYGGVTVVIDNYSFELIQKSIYNSYPIIQICSKHVGREEGYTFWIYQSNSELGLWRYFGGIIEESKFIKGYDYSQSSLIHLTLQKIINGTIHSIPNTTINYEDLMPILCRQYQTSLVLYNGKLTTEQVLWHKTVIAWYKNHGDIKSANIIEQYNGHFISIGQNRIIQNRIIQKNTIFEELNSRLNCGQKGFKVDLVKTQLIDMPTKNYEILQLSSNRFEDEYNFIEDSNIHIIEQYDYIFKDIIQVGGYINCCKLEKKIKNGDELDEIYLYYMWVQLINIATDLTDEEGLNISKICYKEAHVMPFLLTSVASECNFMGLYSDYIPFGSYICKLFDYIE